MVHSVSRMSVRMCWAYPGRLTPFVVIAAVSLMVQATCAAPTGTKPNDRPNIVLIMADDMGFSDIGCYGGEVQTPHLDRMAAEGLRFTQFYNNAKCTTTRASLLTGLYPRPKGGLLKTSMVTIAEVLKSAGYSTCLSGKWHLGSKAPRRPSDRGFDQYFGLLDGCCNFFDPSIRDPKFKGGRSRVVAKDDQRITNFPDDFYMTDTISDYAAGYVKQAAAGDKPFFLHVCYTAPHYPLHAKPTDIARYKGKYMQGWTALREARHGRQIKMGLIDPQWKLAGPNREVKPWESDANKEWQDLRMAVYAAMIDSMDQGIGRILQQLDEAGVSNNTLVLFLSDNGGCAEIPGGEDPRRIPGVKEFYTTCGPGWAYAQNTPFRRYKSWVHEGGISTPLIARWPGKIQPNRITREVAHIIDFLPTFADFASATYPTSVNGNAITPVEGLSMRSLLEGGTRKGHDRIYWEWARNRAVREGDWKLCWDKGIKRWELYDLVADRTETNDLAAKTPERVARMAELWYAWADKTGVRYQRNDSN